MKTVDVEKIILHISESRSFCELFDLAEKHPVDITQPGQLEVELVVALLDICSAIDAGNIAFASDDERSFLLRYLKLGMLQLRDLSFTGSQETEH